MKLTIIVPDNTVYVDNVMKPYALSQVDPINPLDLSTCNIPDNTHALQWNETAGWIEFKDNPDGTKPQNEPITVLPDWANACVTVWNEWTPYVPPTPPSSAQPTTTGTKTA